MAESVASFPERQDAGLLRSVLAYLNSLRERSDVPEDAKESLVIATEVIQGLLPADCSSLWAPVLSLEGAYTEHISALTAKSREEFLEFMRQLHDMGFLKGVEPKSPTFRERLVAAHRGYSDKFPDKDLAPLDALAVVYSDIVAPKKTPTAAAATTEPIVTEPMDSASKTSTTSEPIVTEPIEVSEEQKRQAQVLKDEGNSYLKAREIGKAIDSYSKGIALDPFSPVLFSNRAAAYSYRKEYQKAVDDARKAVELDSGYVKAYVRLAVASKQLGNLQDAHDAYGEALRHVRPTSADWETYMERQQKIKQEIDLQTDSAAVSSAPDAGGPDAFAGFGGGGMPPFGGLPGGGMPGGGGMPDLSSLLGGLSGAGGPGAGGLGALLQNPMMAQMAQQMMQDPNMMQQVTEMMQDPSKMQKMQEAMADPSMRSAMADLMSSPDGESIQELANFFMSNPEAAKAAIGEAMEDPEMATLREDPAVASVVERMQSGDMSALAELSKKPELVKKLVAVAKKYAK